MLFHIINFIFQKANLQPKQVLLNNKVNKISICKYKSKLDKIKNFSIRFYWILLICIKIRERLTKKIILNNTLLIIQILIQSNNNY